MADRLSKVKALMFGANPASDDDEYESEYGGPDDAEDTDVVEYAPATRPTFVRHAMPEAGATVTPLVARRRPSPVGTSATAGPSQIVHIRPRAYAEAATIGDTYRESVPIILNFSVTDQIQAQKLFDFCSGMAYVTRGKLDRITSNVFLLLPAGMALTDAERTQLGSESYGPN